HVLDQKRHAQERLRAAGGGELGVERLDHGIDGKVFGLDHGPGGSQDFLGGYLSGAHQARKTQTILRLVVIHMHEIRLLLDKFSKRGPGSQPPVMGSIAWKM